MLAQASAGEILTEMPPRPDVLVDSMVIAFTGPRHDLHRAHWAHVKRNEYLDCLLLRRKVNPVYQHVKINEAAMLTEVPDAGTPVALEACLLEMPDLPELKVRQEWPGGCTHGQPEAFEAVDSDESAAEELDDTESAAVDVAEPILMQDPLHDVEPVRMLQVFQKRLEQMKEVVDMFRCNEKNRSGDTRWRARGIH